MQARKTAVAAVVAMMAFACVSEAQDKPGWLRRAFCHLTWQETIAVVETPKEICSAVRHNVSYLEDMGDEQQSGLETWEKGTGDCEDFAAAVVDLSKRKGFEAAMYVFRIKESGIAHAVAVGRHDGKMWLSSNGWYRQIDSWDNAREFVAREMGWRSRQIIVEAMHPQDEASMVARN